MREIFPESLSSSLFNNHAFVNDDALWVISWSRRTWLMSAASPVYLKGELITVTTCTKESQHWESHRSNPSIKEVVKESARRFSVLGSTLMMSDAPSMSSQCRYRSTKRGDWKKTVMAKVGKQVFYVTRIVHILTFNTSANKRTQ